MAYRCWACVNIDMCIVQSTVRGDSLPFTFFLLADVSMLSLCCVYCVAHLQVVLAGMFSWSARSNGINIKVSSYRPMVGWLFLRTGANSSDGFSMQRLIKKNSEYFIVLAKSKYKLDLQRKHQILGIEHTSGSGNVIPAYRG